MSTENPSSQSPQLSPVDQLNCGYITVTYGYAVPCGFSDENWVVFCDSLKRSLLHTVNTKCPVLGMATRWSETRGCYLDGELPPFFNTVDCKSSQNAMPLPLGLNWNPPPSALEWEDSHPDVVAKVAERTLVVTVARLRAGFVVTVRIPHSVADGGSVAMFVNAWSEDHRAQQACQPDMSRPECAETQTTDKMGPSVSFSHDRSVFSSASDPPPEAPEAYSGLIPVPILSCKETKAASAMFPSRAVGKRLTRAALSELKKLCGSTHAFTSNDAICASLMRDIAVEFEEGFGGTLRLIFPADLRGRFPGVPANYFGSAIYNCSLAPLSLTQITAACQDPDAPLQWLASQVHEAKEEGLQEHKVRALLAWETARETRPRGFVFPPDAHFVLSSWVRFPFYSADFGYGRPVLVTPTSFIRPPFCGYILPTENEDVFLEYYLPVSEPKQAAP
mmetsp:Transcript_43597/g.102488  ORF Transcript_43597/g.102488 Transcript_43597/m.102488 type:complete len:448 (-) Transcript_43597:484-1827(-)|eukprot:3586312-Rhodomonas_salina.1